MLVSTLTKVNDNTFYDFLSCLITWTSHFLPGCCAACSDSLANPAFCQGLRASQWWFDISWKRPKAFFKNIRALKRPLKMKKINSPLRKMKINTSLRKEEDQFILEKDAEDQFILEKDEEGQFIHDVSPWAKLRICWRSEHAVQHPGRKDLVYANWMVLIAVKWLYYSRLPYHFKEIDCITITLSKSIIPESIQ